jgi:hypothetical protein
MRSALHKPPLKTPPRSHGAATKVRAGQGQQTLNYCNEDGEEEGVIKAWNNKRLFKRQRHPSLLFGLPRRKVHSPVATIRAAASMSPMFGGTNNSFLALTLPLMISCTLTHSHNNNSSMLFPFTTNSFETLLPSILEFNATIFLHSTIVISHNSSAFFTEESQQIWQQEVQRRRDRQ